VAASKLRRAQERAEAARPYAERMERMVQSLAQSVAGNESAPAMLRGSGREDTHLLVVATSDRGLCGGFNSSIVRAARQRIVELEVAGKSVKLFVIGRKGRDQLGRDHGGRFVETLDNIGVRGPQFAEAATIAETLSELYAAGEFDVCAVVYNKFKSAISQIVTFQQLIPFAADEEAAAIDLGGAIYEFEPDEAEILDDLLPRNAGVQMYRALLENAASEQGARMMAMDNATRNAGDMIDKLSLTYNRTRQAAITTELVEIVSGAEVI